MTDFTDPERRQQLDMKKLRMDQCWRRREIGDATYLRSLFIMGYLPDEANTELNLLKMEEPAVRYKHAAEDWSLIASREFVVAYSARKGRENG